MLNSCETQRDPYSSPVVPTSLLCNMYNLAGLHHQWQWLLAPQLGRLLFSRTLTTVLKVENFEHVKMLLTSVFYSWRTLLFYCTFCKKLDSCWRQICRSFKLRIPGWRSCRSFASPIFNSHLKHPSSIWTVINWFICCSYGKDLCVLISARKFFPFIMWSHHWNSLYP